MFYLYTLVRISLTICYYIFLGKSSLSIYKHFPPLLHGFLFLYLLRLSSPRLTYLLICSQALNHLAPFSNPCPPFIEYKGDWDECYLG